MRVREVFEHIGCEPSSVLNVSYLLYRRSFLLDKTYARRQHARTRRTWLAHGHLNDPFDEVLGLGGGSLDFGQAITGWCGLLVRSSFATQQSFRLVEQCVQLQLRPLRFLWSHRLRTGRN